MDLWKIIKAFFIVDEEYANFKGQALYEYYNNKYVYGKVWNVKYYKDGKCLS